MFVFTAPPVPSLAQTFALVIVGLCRATASRIAVDRGAGPLLIRIFTRLHRLAARLTSLLARIQAGKQPPPGRSRPATGRRDRPKTRLPDSFGWLIRLVPVTAEYTGQVQALLGDPETAALLETAPQAGRTLRPLCRMLAIPLPDALRVPRPQAAPPASARTVAIRLPPLRPPRRPPDGRPPMAGARANPRQGAATVVGLPPLPD